MSQREGFTIDLPGEFGHYKADCVVANRMLTIESSIGTRTIDAGASADVPTGKARLEFKAMILQHEASLRAACGN
jgi:hypothetical protein